ncbi:LPS export ABC transporter permease LptG [Actibacterium sp. 188UL27-1]|uniref:LPS export ABC transporter permease LptG n=1 Tax=Actibacterium sp. 188UL27-1 TaxID=2786961 RepID=UPI001957FA5E|nr:LPS export ABC transporter permease LptG [Actibacterium sp. 188UL27-1]MBM7067487.1 LPS export ABC transporter permease LptG [Actibacterium sp. 188UL27-1]
MRLHIYFAKKFALSFGGVLLVFFGMLTLVDTVEQMRRFDGADISFAGALGLSVLSVPETLYKILPLIMILATLALFLGLARTSEMVVTRASGRSALRALVAPVVTAILIGGLGVAVLNPIVAATQQQYEIRSQQYRLDGGRVISVNDEGLWLRQGSADGQSVIRAARTSLDGTELFGATFLEFDTNGQPIRRIEAERADLGRRVWQLTNAKIWPLVDTENPERQAETHARYEVASNLTRDQIRDSFGTPSSIPIWELPAFIENLDRAGFSARSHRVWFHTEMAMPAFLAAMVMIGAGFTMRHTRFGRTGQMVLLALLLGLGVFFIRNFAQILGENGQIPILLAAWAPPIAAILLSLALLLHLEDG